MTKLAAAFLSLALFRAPLAGQDTPWPTVRWTTSTPEEQGMDSSRLEEASQFIEQNCPTRLSFLVVRQGRLVFESYHHGSRATDTNNVKSMSKSMLSVLTGIAIEEGFLAGTDQKLYQFFPEYFRDGDDPRKWDITLAHLLTMTAGFEWTENDALSDQWFFSRSDKHRFIIELPLNSTPGAAFGYNTGLTHLMSGILTRTTGMSTLAYANARLFDPLGMTVTRWSQDAHGYYFGGSEVWLSARDLAKFGLLFLRNGLWDGRRIVSEEWLRASSRLRIRTNNPLGDYGWWWWKYTINGYDVTLASGYGGQNIFLVPDLDLLMVTTARSDIPIAQNTYDMYAQPYNVLSRWVIPSVQADPPRIDDVGIAPGAGHGTRLAAGAFARIIGSGFSLVESTWDGSIAEDGALPSGVAGVRVRLNGRTAYPSRVRPGEIVFLVPPDLPAGAYRLDVITQGGRASRDVEVVDFAPAFYTAAVGGHYSAFPRPVHAGETIELWATGLGPSVPAAPSGAVLPGPLPLASAPEVLVAGQPAKVVYAALASTGLWQVNIRVPEALEPGVVSVQVRAGGVLSGDGAVLEIIPEGGN